MSFRFWIILHSTPKCFTPQELFHLEPVNFPILEIGISLFWSVFIFASSCSLALDNGGYYHVAIAGLFMVALLACFLANAFICYKRLINHDPWDSQPSEENNPNKEKKEVNESWTTAAVKI